MQIEHIREFLLVSRIASITETARRLYVTQSALSRHITALEEEVGLKLFDRLANQVRLTAAGETFFEHAKVIVKVYDNGIEHLSHMKNQSRPILRIGYLCDASKRFIPKIMRALDSGIDDLNIQYEAMEYGELVASFLEKRIDVGLTLDIDMPEDESVRFVPLAEDRYQAVVPFGHPFSKRESITVCELAERGPLLFPDEKTMLGVRRFFAQTLADSGVHVQEKATYRDIPSLAYMVEHGGGISMMLSHHSWRYKDSFAFVPIEDATNRCRIGLMWSSSSERTIPGKWAEVLLNLQGKSAKERPVLSGK